MSSPARALFLLVLCISCVLWAQARYGDRTESSRVDNLEVAPCQPLALPLHSQCSHVKTVCDSSTTFLAINYLEQYYCSQPSLRPLAFISLLVWLLFLFSTLGITASDFFTPNLATIALQLGLDENVAGVTFLAFGNGSPDLSATFSAMKAGSGSLAIGELLGAASFIVSCVVGSMCIIRPFHVYRWPFLRDVGFFTVAVTMLLIILRDGEIHLWEAVSMIVLYVCYALVVGFGSWWAKRQEHKKQLESMVRSEFDQRDFVPYRDQRKLLFSSVASHDLIARQPTHQRPLNYPRCGSLLQPLRGH
jgi:solute carrier family 24 (sodium/potassium/calcium exchanger), member 6